jgi:CubicO group peptidase (beta-lactamase class C family)
MVRSFICGFLLSFLMLNTLVQAQIDGLTIWKVAALRQAKTVCSGVFISGRSTDDILVNDLDVLDVKTVTISVNQSAKKVDVTLDDGFVATAIYRPECGCTIVLDANEAEIRAQETHRIPILPPLTVSSLWPKGEGVNFDKTTSPINQRKMQKAMDYAFDEPHQNKKLKRGTRAAVVVYDGKIVSEQYAEGFTKDMPLITWSMNKSIVNALAGIMVKKGKLDIHKNAPVPEWKNPDDPRHPITTDQLLRMSSGLSFVEEYSPQLVDVVVMLYGTTNAGQYAATRPLKSAPDSEWYYSSGTTNIISRIIRHQLKDYPTYAAFPYAELFNKLGMHRTTFEMDASGTFIGSSFAYSTARDMARFGQFLLEDGVWNGERILPEGWVEYSTTPTSKCEKGDYGAQIWLNRGETGNSENRRWPHLPTDAFGFSGFDGQSVAIIPSRNAVIVRLGRTKGGQAAWDQDIFMGKVLKALPKD